MRFIFIAIAVAPSQFAGRLGYAGHTGPPVGVPGQSPRPGCLPSALVPASTPTADRRSMNATLIEQIKLLGASRCAAGPADCKARLPASLCQTVFSWRCRIEHQG